MNTEKISEQQYERLLCYLNNSPETVCVCCACALSAKLTKKFAGMGKAWLLL